MAKKVVNKIPSFALVDEQAPGRPSPSPTVTEPSAVNIVSLIRQDVPVGHYKALQAHMPPVRATADGSDCADHCRVFVEISQNGHKDLWPLYSERVADELVSWNDRMTGGDPEQFLTRSRMNQLREYIEGTSHRTADMRRVRKRLDWSPAERAIRLDLSQPSGLVAKTTGDGWTSETPDKPMFARFATQRPAPTPIRSDEGPAAFARMCPPSMSPEQRKLLLGALLGCLIPSNFTRSFGYPVIWFCGEEGSAKSSLAALVKRLIDPEVISLAAKPTRARDIYVTAQTSFMLAYDNLTDVKGISNTLCQISTGSQFVRRQGFTDTGLVVLPAHGPVILTGIALDNLPPDLADRMVTIKLRRLTHYDPEAVERADRDAGIVLGYLLDLLSVALRNYETTHLAQAPRLATLARVVAAAEPFGCDTPFVDILRAAQTNDLMSTDDHSPVTDALVNLLKATPEWRGTYKQFLALLETKAGDGANSPEWPKTPRKLSAFAKSRRRMLREMGIDIEDGDKVETGRLVTVRRTATFSSDTSAA
ncbi:MAG: hypothetical protein ABL907_03970 [Hyphomicrobium sp.]